MLDADDDTLQGDPSERLLMNAFKKRILLQDDCNFQREEMRKGEKNGKKIGVFLKPVVSMEGNLVCFCM